MFGLYIGNNVSTLIHTKKKFQVSHPVTVWCVLFGQENGKNRLQQVQEDVEEVKVIMLDNLNKADERSNKLNELEDRADELLAKVSRRSSDKMFRWKHFIT